MGENRDASVETHLNTCVKEYLQYVDLSKTVEVLDDELKQLGRPLLAASSSEFMKNEVKVLISMITACSNRLFIYGRVK